MFYIYIFRSFYICNCIFICICLAVGSLVRGWPHSSGVRLSEKQLIQYRRPHTQVQKYRSSQIQKYRIPNTNPQIYAPKQNHKLVVPVHLLKVALGHRRVKGPTFCNGQLHINWVLVDFTNFTKSFFGILRVDQ